MRNIQIYLKFKSSMKFNTNSMKKKRKVSFKFHNLLNPITYN